LRTGARADNFGLFIAQCCKSIWLVGLALALLLLAESGLGYRVIPEPSLLQDWPRRSNNTQEIWLWWLV
jgi:hypothetical protein